MIYAVVTLILAGIVILIIFDNYLKARDEEMKATAAPETKPVLEDNLLNWYAFKFDNDNIHERTGVSFETYVDLNINGKWRWTDSHSV